jgi:hypothetical protein
LPGISKGIYILQDTVNQTTQTWSRKYVLIFVQDYKLTCPSLFTVEKDHKLRSRGTEDTVDLQTGK